jgi:DNA repair protein RadD
MAAPILRPFQAELKSSVYSAWRSGAKNVLMRLDTGGGKTVTLSDIVREHDGASCVIAHRQELVGQLSLALARYGVRHDVIAAGPTKRAISRLHVEELGYSFVTPGARCVVAGVDTIIRDESLAAWAATVTLWIVDEGHHVVRGNKWHTVIERFSHPHCRGLLPTATPKRADGKGLGRHADGVADVMVQGPPMRWLIDNGFLSDYRIICPPSDMQVLAEVSASGDWSTHALREAAKRSHIVGDVVTHYLKWAPGKLGVTFSSDIETAGEIAVAFRAAGVRAEVLTGKTDDFVRRQTLRRFAAREIDQIVAVDIISEGFDLPAIEVASMARPTASLALYMQQFGRTLRPLPGKGAAIIIDHASNVVRHGGPPDRPREWSLDRRGKRASGASDGIPIRVCPADGCYTPYPAIKRVCPVCGHYVPPAERGSPAAVAGDLCELSPEVLAGLRADVASVDMGIPERRAELAATGLPHVLIMANVKRHAERQEAQVELREAMGLWGGARTVEGLSNDEIQRLFFYRFGVDVLSAQALGAVDALALRDRLFA